MNLLSTEQVNWTVPVPQKARYLLRELATLEGTDEPKAKARKDEILSQLPRLVRYRLTFKSVTIYEENQRDKFLRETRIWFQETYGVSASDFIDWYFDTYAKKIESTVEFERGKDMSKEDAQNIFAETQDIGNWATILCCLQKLEEGTVDAADPDAEPAWREIAVPAEWKNFQSFIELIPRPLFETCATVCHDLNPGMWRMGMDDEAKNFGGVSVTR